MENGFSLDGLLNKLNYMKLFKNPRTGLITIWCDSMYEQYMYYSKREAMRLFKKKHGLRGKVTEVDWCLFSL